MDLSDLLDPERIRCHSDVKSKKRTLQTLAELLGESLRAKKDGAGSAEASSNSDSPGSTNENGGRSVLPKINKKSRKSNNSPDSEPESLSDMEILDALIGRERLGSTGLGHGVGLPHSRLSTIKEPIAALLTLDKGVDYESADDQPVDLVLGLLVPENCNDEHLKILAQLAKRFSDDSLRNTLRTFDNPDRLYAHLCALAPVSN